MRTITEQKARQIAGDFYGTGYGHLQAFAQGNTDDQLETYLDILNDLSYLFAIPERALRPYEWSYKDRKALQTLFRYLERKVFTLHGATINWHVDFYGHREPFAIGKDGQVIGYEPNPQQWQDKPEFWNLP